MRAHTRNTEGAAKPGRRESVVRATEQLDISLSDSMIRRLRLNIASLAGDRRVNHHELMEASNSRLELLARGSAGSDATIANGITGCPREFLRWEAEHARAMRVVAWQMRRSLQLRALLYLGTEMIHRAALFEAMRSHRVRGAMRRLLVSRFHGQLSYTQALVSEHGVYRRSAASLLCIRHLSNAVFEVPAATEALDRYCGTYNDYFATYCDVATSDVPGESREELLPELKSAVGQARQAVLGWGRNKAAEPAAATRKRA